MKVVVTGAAGYVGSALAASLVQEGHDVLALTRPGGRSLAAPLPAGITQLAVDLNDKVAVGAALAAFRADAVVHAAASIFNKTDAETVARAGRDNIDATATLLDAAGKAGVPGVIFLSSISVYGPTPQDAAAGYLESDPIRPDSDYGRQKAEGERLCIDWQRADPARHLVILRLAGVHGGNRTAGAVYNMIKAAQAGADIQVAEPDSTFSFLHVMDGVDAIRNALAALPSIPADCLNIAGGEQVTLSELAKTIVTCCDSPSKLLLGERPARTSALNVEKAQTVIGFAPTQLSVWLQAECRRAGDKDEPA